MTNAQITTAGINAVVGELVHTHMWRGKVTQTSLAAYLGIGQPSIARKLRGERPFTIDEILAVSEFLNVPITELLPNAENPRPEGPDGGDETNGLRIKSPKLFQLSYRGERDFTNVVPMRREVAA